MKVWKPWMTWTVTVVWLAVSTYFILDNWTARVAGFAWVIITVVLLVKWQTRRVDRLRAKAAAELGERFDPTVFDAMLSSADFTKGPVAYQVDAWIAAEKAKR